MTSDSKVNILLVDDRPENLIALESVLADLGQNLVKASSGGEALKQLLDQDFAVILMDVQMPDMDGFETARIIRAREKTQHIPIVFLTAINKSEDHVSHGYSVGAVDYVFKPFSPDILKAKVATFVELSRKTLELQQEIAQRQHAEAQVRKLNTRLERRVKERTSELETANRELEQEVVERRRAEEERFLSLELERRARAEAEAAQTRLSFLGEASSELAGSLDYQTTLERIARLPIDYLADFALVYICGDDELQRSATAHCDAEGEERLQELPRAVPLRSGNGSVLAATTRSVRPELHATVNAAWITRAFPDENTRAVLERLDPVSLMFLPLITRGTAMGVLLLGTSVSGRRFSSEDLATADDLAQRSAAALENARLYWQLQEAARRKDEFLAMLAHELRNPLAAISNAGHILRETEARDERSRQLRDIINRQAEHLSRLVDDLLDTARITRGKIDLRKVPVRLESAVQRAVETSSALLHSCGHRLTVELPDETVWLDADPTRLEQILWNLLNNAAKYTEPGGEISLRAEIAGAHGRDRASDSPRSPEHDALAPASPGGGPEVIIRVRDSGIGIAPELVGRVFDLFTQADRSLDRAQGGLGIGLALVRSLVQLHGGTVGCHSEGVGRGSEFIVRLPIRGQTPRDVPPLPELPGHLSPEGSSEGLGKRILIVEDNLDAAETLNDLLELWGHEVRVAINGPMALDTAATYRPEAILLDIGLPGMNGYEVAHRLREMPETEGSLLLALTGYGHEDDRKRAREAGFDRHLTKPVDPEELRAMLNSWALEVRQASAPSVVGAAGGFANGGKRRKRKTPTAGVK